MKIVFAILGMAFMLHAASGSALYQKCAACHGAKGEKMALGKSEVIAGWKEAKTVEALKGYKSGKRNIKGMGGLMKGQVVKLSNADIKALAKYIATLKK